MEVIIRSEGVKLSQAMTDYIHKKLEKLTKYLKNTDDIRITVMVRIRNDEQTVEITIPLKSIILRTEESKEDFYIAVDKSIDKLERQIRKNKTKLMTRESKHAYEFSFSDMVEENIEDESKVIKRKSVEVKPMDDEEAILQLELLGHQFYVYKDRETLKTCVLYKRKDGNYGIIESE